MTRSHTPGAATGARNSDKDYSRCEARSDAATLDTSDALDDDLAAHEVLAAAPAAFVAERSAGGAAGGEAPRVVTVPPELAGERLDKVLAKVFPEFSRSRLQSWIEAQRVQVDGM